MNQRVLFEIKKFKSELSCCFFTDRKKVSDFTKIIKNLPKNSAIIIREYDLNIKDREIFAQKITDLARIENQRKSLKIIVGKDLELARKIKADGIHFSDYDKLPLSFLKKESFPTNFIFSLSCHSLRSATKFQKIKPDLLFLSPIFSTTSHVGAQFLGLRNLAKIAFKRKSQKYFSIYALGGVNSENLTALRKLGISGFGAIDFFVKI